MGYTHYWSHKDIPPGAWAELCSDARRLIKAAGVPLAGWDGTGKPSINGDEIRLNGVDDDGCETFALSPAATDFDFCKTGREPYDEVVCAVLLRARLTIPDFKIWSDGGWYSDDWTPGRKLVTRVFGQAPENSQLDGDE